MKLSDVVERATQGQMRIEETSIPRQSLLVGGDVQVNSGISLQMNTYDAALLAHWWNTGPKLLKMIEDEILFDDDTRWTKDHLRKIVAECE